MTTNRSVSVVLAGIACIGALFAGMGLHQGLMGSVDLLIAWVQTTWSGHQIETAMLFAGPLSMVFLALGLALMFASLRFGKPQ